jgi:hypothetical protein
MKCEMCNTDRPKQTEQKVAEQSKSSEKSVEVPRDEEKFSSKPREPRAVDISRMRFLLFTLDTKIQADLVKNALMRAYIEKAKLPSSKHFVLDCYDQAMTTVKQNYLQQYDAVLVWNNATAFLKPHINALTEYVEHGGSVVVAAFSTSTAYGLHSRWETMGFSPIIKGKRAKKVQSLVDFSKNFAHSKHPIFRNVRTFNPSAAANYDLITAKPTARTLATYADNTPLIVEQAFDPNHIQEQGEEKRKARAAKKAEKGTPAKAQEQEKSSKEEKKEEAQGQQSSLRRSMVVVFNFYPPSLDSVSDGSLLLLNCLAYAGSKNQLASSIRRDLPPTTAM